MKLGRRERKMFILGKKGSVQRQNAKIKYEELKGV